jgi:hypothetical protein
MIDHHRDELAALVGAKWKDLFKVKISFADGSSARISAINAALKPYRFSHYLRTVCKCEGVCLSVCIIPSRSIIN